MSDLARQWEGWGTALKPAFEPIVMARKPVSEGSVVANVLKHGTGAINVDGCRVAYASEADAAAAAAAAQRACHDSAGRVRWGSDGTPGTGFQDPAGSLAGWNEKADMGRWPANVLHDGSGQVRAAMPGSDIEGGAARIFYSAKADADDRLGSKHPTVKPVELMRWLVRLVTPPGGVVLDPFAGSGSTGVAAVAEGFQAVLIEQSAEYAGDIRRRLSRLTGGGGHKLAEKQRARPATDAGPLFAAKTDGAA